MDILSIVTIITLLAIAILFIRGLVVYVIARFFTRYITIEVNGKFITIDLKSDELITNQIKRKLGE